MEFSEIELKHTDTKSSDAAVYVNTIISTESVAHATSPKSENTGESESYYETLRFGTKQTEADQNATRNIRWEDLPNRMKYTVYVIIAVTIILFVVDIVAIVLIVRQKDKVDGNWIQWSSWSNCDVTCTNGTQTRMRFCINPAPSNGGADCSGKSIDIKQCENDNCLDGGWSSWSSWGLCSDSCDGGVRSRLRTCTNPVPSLLGRYCDGSPEQVMSCNKHTCSDGGWSSWGSWGSCSDSCDGGVRTRLRTCTNPKPSLHGRYCDGSNEQVIQCNKHTCSDGGWSNWDSWGSCSDSCGGGVQTRLRTCTNPRPSLLGRHCDGSNEQVRPCNKHTCSDHKVAFTVYGSTSGTSNAVIKFRNTHLNIGGGYSTSTGRFTCKIPGIYNFAVTLTKNSPDIDYISAYLRLNNSYKLQLWSYSDGSNSMTVAGNFHLNKNDYVDVYGIPSNFYHDHKAAFAGVLVIPDE